MSCSSFPAREPSPRRWGTAPRTAEPDRAELPPAGLGCGRDEASQCADRVPGRRPPAFLHTRGCWDLEPGKEQPPDSAGVGTASCSSTCQSQGLGPRGQGTPWWGPCRHCQEASCPPVLRSSRRETCWRWCLGLARWSPWAPRPQAGPCDHEAPAPTVRGTPEKTLRGPAALPGLVEDHASAFIVKVRQLFASVSAFRSSEREDVFVLILIQSQLLQLVCL